MPTKIDVSQIGWSEAVLQAIKIGTTELGDELVTNGTFDSDSSNWTLESDWSHSNGKLVKAAGDSDVYATITQTVSGVETNSLYLLEFEISDTVTAGSMLISLGGTHPSTSPVFVGSNGNGTYRQLFKAGGTTLSIATIGTSTALSIDNISLKKVYTPADGKVALWSSQELDGTESSLHITSEDGTTHTFGETVAINSFNNQGGGILSVHSRADGENFLIFHNDRHGFVDWAFHNDGNDLVIQQSPINTPVDVMTFEYNASSPKVGISCSPAYKLDINGDIRVRGNDIRDNSGNAAITFDGSANTTINGYLNLKEKSSDPSNPSEGNSVLWMSDGTGTGDDGDILMKITAGGVTKTVTLVDFSAS